MSSLDSSLTWKFLGVGVTYPVLPIYCGYELVDERVRSRAFILHFRLEVLDQLLVSWIELDAGRQPHPILLAVTAINPIRKGCTTYHSTDAREGVQLCAYPDRKAKRICQLHIYMHTGLLSIFSPQWGQCLAVEIRCSSSFSLMSFEELLLWPLFMSDSYAARGGGAHA